LSRGGPRGSVRSLGKKGFRWAEDLWRLRRDLASKILLLAKRREEAFIKKVFGERRGTGWDGVALPGEALNIKGGSRGCRVAEHDGERTRPLLS